MIYLLFKEKLKPRTKMKQLKDLPCACHKSDIYRIFSTFSILFLRTIMIETIMEKRNCTKKEAQYARALRKNEVAYLLEVLGEE